LARGKPGRARSRATRRRMRGSAAANGISRPYFVSSRTSRQRW